MIDSPTIIKALKRDKYSCNKAGLIYYDDMYEVDQWNRKKRSVLRGVVLKEYKLLGKKYPAKYKVWFEFCKRIKEIIAAKTWEGYLPESQDWKRYNYLTCGKHGKREENSAGDKRHLVYNCHQTKICPACDERYHKGRSRKAEAIAVAVMQAHNIRDLRKFRLTFPEHIRNQIKTEDQALVFKRLANEFLQELYGCEKDHRGVYQRGSVGVSIEFHWRSTQECWKVSPHMHCSVIPVRLGKGEVGNLDIPFYEDDLEYMRKRWVEMVERAAAKLGFQDVDKIPDEGVVNLDYINLPKNVRQKQRPGFKFGYDMRSPVHDLQKAVAAINMRDEKLIMSFKRGRLGYFENWSFEHYVDVLVKLLSYRRLTSTYGWQRRFEKDSHALGVEVQKADDDFNAIDALSVLTEYRREYQREINTKKQTVKVVKHLSVRLLPDIGNPGPWVEIDPWNVHGEEIWTGSKKRYLYGVARGKSPPDRGG